MTDLSEMQWLDDRLRKWGRERRRILTGRRVFGDGWQHVDGWQSVSVAARLIDGGITGGSGVATQHYAEVYSEDVLPTWRAVRALNHEGQLVVNLHYVLPGVPAKKWQFFPSKADYYVALFRAKNALLGGIWPGDAVTR